MTQVLIWQAVAIISAATSARVLAGLKGVSNKQILRVVRPPLRRRKLRRPQALAVSRWFFCGVVSGILARIGLSDRLESVTHVAGGHGAGFRCLPHSTLLAGRSHVVAMNKLIHCSVCSFSVLARSRVRWYEWPIILLGLRPYRCQSCQRRFWC